jgi:hypothetical protein
MSAKRMRQEPWMIRTLEYRLDIMRTLNDVGLRDCGVEFVDSVREWARSVGVQEDNPGA